MSGISNIVNTAAAIRMSSVEIAGLVESRHDSVKRTVERLAERGVISLPPMVEVRIQRERREEAVSAYVFAGEQGKRDSYVVVAQLSPEFTARLVDRWQALEASVQQMAIPQTLPEALRLAADLAEQKAEAEAALAIAEPKARALDRIETGTDGSFCLTDAAKALQVQPRKFMARLQQMGWIYRRPMGSGWLAYQERITMGVLEHKVTSGERSDGSEWATTQVRVTAKGMARLAMLIAKEEVPA